MQKDLDLVISYNDLYQTIENNREQFKLNQSKIKILYQKKNKEKAKIDQNLKLTIQLSKYKNLEKNNKNSLSTNHHLGTGSGIAA